MGFTALSSVAFCKIAILHACIYPLKCYAIQWACPNANGMVGVIDA